jgi:hypothetical protein
MGLDAQFVSHLKRASTVDEAGRAGNTNEDPRPLACPLIHKLDKAMLPFKRSAVLVRNDPSQALCLRDAYIKGKDQVGVRPYCGGIAIGVGGLG